jgi:hypothetical protein
MRRREIAARLALAACVIGGSAALGCVVVQDRETREVVERPAAPPRGKGPPPHAPAHGYRRKFQQDGVTLELDTGRGVYVVVELEDVFFFEKRYYRCEDARWLASVRPDGGWVVIAIGDVPAGLRDYKPHPGKGKGKKKH